MLRVPGVRFLFLAAWPAALVSCIRLAPKIETLPPAAVPDRFILCAKVTRTADWADFSLVGGSFIRGRDETICAVVDFRALRGAHRLVWKWYDPEGKLARASDRILVGEDGSEFERFLAWDEFPVSGAMPLGRWAVALFIDDRFAGSREFQWKEAFDSGSSPGGDAKNLVDPDHRSF